DAAAGVADHLRVGVDDHAVGDGPGAGGDGFGRGFFDFDQAHAAVAGDRETVVIAEAWYFDAGGLAGLEDRGAGGDFDLGAVDGEFGHAAYSAAIGMREEP